MKKVQDTQRSYSIWLKNIELYKEDLEEIVSVFESSNTNYKLVVNGYELDDVNELQELDKKSRSVFSIRNINSIDFYPHLKIELTKKSLFIYQNPASDVNLSGLAFQVKSIVEGKTNKFLRFISSPLFPIIYLVPTFFLPLFETSYLQKILISCLSYSMFGLQYLWIYSYHSKNNCILFLTNKWEKENFFSKNKDTIIISIGSAVIGAILGALFTRGC